MKKALEASGGIASTPEKPDNGKGKKPAKDLPPGLQKALEKGKSIPPNMQKRLP